ncbi:uncharacterized protein N7496_004980 [Penicillium cataractarum]|uniref:Uncharacterized protein n=1 Tax=Penicillium cataractarum TaxID=2100454 RepID=A0A9W9SF99_9EURO|nr:uncharacterized protein N7496_004980 [Penicillium cataractarum]KAJ5377571.1 hypothetical protein N7496_004980 [Penicillium cataractarum]
MRLTSLAALGLVGCALALPGRHNGPNRQRQRDIPTMTIDLTEPGSAPSLTPRPTPTWTPQPSRRPIPTTSPGDDSGDGGSDDVPDSIRQAQQQLYDDMEKGASQEELQKDVDNIWSAEVAAYESWLATQTSISVPSGDPSASAFPSGDPGISARPTPSRHPRPSGGWHSPGGQGGARMSTFATASSSSAFSVPSSEAGDG